MKGLMFLLAAALLVGCARQAGPDAPLVRWNCDSQQTIAWRYADKDRRSVDLRIGRDSQIHRLRLEPATRGAFYSDGVIALHDKGSEVLVYRVADDRVLAHGCSASLINF
ncbi:hypothetical protein DN824_02450 [Stutzerimonas nosocomialis]|uniref:C-type lysozyme inhibitor domain-containing protein n=1 Tax=Stutzerimonas nosocomialis TaxID=1056496 RepID=A0A5R9QGV0_9GAMM|nr:MliC family protein [Stutzerimonas nosocomialis]TLX53884.1 hypothetical protein DN826_16500 [Stutzerimonas nosocomialis]TLX60807.1 hypothetical protein DN824_02450 [Stutzerimonas nosocomialis]TLX64437.1 hypothetical protein DN820_05180 [Stutzerimonas nosocomialis]